MGEDGPPGPAVRASCPPRAKSRPSPDEETTRSETSHHIHLVTGLSKGFAACCVQEAKQTSLEHIHSTGKPIAWQTVRGSNHTALKTRLTHDRPSTLAHLPSWRARHAAPSFVARSPKPPRPSSSLPRPRICTDTRRSAIHSGSASAAPGTILSVMARTPWQTHASTCPSKGRQSPLSKSNS